MSDRLVRLRRDQGLTTAELAERAGLSERTVRDIERGRRVTVQEKTLLVLAQALELELDELLGRAPRLGSPALDAGTVVPSVTASASPAAPAPGGRTRRRWKRPVLVLAALLLAGGAALRHLETTRATWTISAGTVTVRGGVTGRVLWRHSRLAKVRVGRRAPWSPDQLLVGYQHDGVDGGCLDCLDLGSGRLLWSVEPDRHRLAHVFGGFNLGDLSCHFSDLVPLDADGDGTPEIAVSFKHILYFPTCLYLVDSKGRVLRQYYHWGHISRLQSVPLPDGAGAALLAAGCNNAPVYQGATLVWLDWEHWGGASFDALSRPGAPEADSSRVRLVFPNFGPGYRPYLGPRPSFVQLNIGADTDGRFLVHGGIGNAPYNLNVLLDRELRPLRVDINDCFLALKPSLPDSLTGPDSPFDPQWREQWLHSVVRFESGRLVSPPQSPPLPLGVQGR